MAKNETQFVIARDQAASEIAHASGCQFAALLIADRCECAKSIRTVIPVLRADDQALGYVEMITGPGGMSTLAAYSRRSSEPSIRLGEHDSVEDAAHAIYDDTVLQDEREYAWRRHCAEYAKTTTPVALPLFGDTEQAAPAAPSTAPLFTAEQAPTASARRPANSAAPIPSRRPAGDVALFDTVLTLPSETATGPLAFQFTVD
jgi:hypothetical protein